MTRVPPTDATLDEAVAWHRGGRKASPAHPLCTCRRPVNYPPKPDCSIDWDGHRACETVEERKAFLVADYQRTRAEVETWRTACEAARQAARCPIHNELPSKWSKPW